MPSICQLIQIYIFSWDLHPELQTLVSFPAFHLIFPLACLRHISNLNVQNWISDILQKSTPFTIFPISVDDHSIFPVVQRKFLDSSLTSVLSHPIQLGLNIYTNRSLFITSSAVTLDWLPLFLWNFTAITSKLGFCFVLLPQLPSLGTIATRWMFLNVKWDHSPSLLNTLQCFPIEK